VLTGLYDMKASSFNPETRIPHLNKQVMLEQVDEWHAAAGDRRPSDSPFDDATTTDGHGWQQGWPALRDRSTPKTEWRHITPKRVRVYRVYGRYRHDEGNEIRDQERRKQHAMASALHPDAANSESQASCASGRGVNRDNTVLVRTVAAYVKRRIEVKVSNISDHVHIYMVSIVFKAFCNI